MEMCCTCAWLAAWYAKPWLPWDQSTPKQPTTQLSEHQPTTQTTQVGARRRILEAAKQYALRLESTTKMMMIVNESSNAAAAARAGGAGSASASGTHAGASASGLSGAPVGTSRRGSVDFGHWAQGAGASQTRGSSAAQQPLVVTSPPGAGRDRPFPAGMTGAATVTTAGPSPLQMASASGQQQQVMIPGQSPAGWAHRPNIATGMSSEDGVQVSLSQGILDQEPGSAPTSPLILPMSEGQVSGQGGTGAAAL